ncbi:MAG TPA: NAD-dependent epimerase/dehydratase family protein [Dehalococcoidia bacterium]|nr:NAD-dependent epimerase/dehydratase family protein [Dehalococcoidia bacterium]
MRVLVTGGAGFIGSAVTRVLLQEQHDVTVLDNLSKGFRQLVPDGARFIEGDLRDEERLPGWLRGHDAVIHMAAFIEVARSVQEPLVFAENNIINSVRLLEAMHRAEVGKIVFSSSATVYGTPKTLPIRETDPLGVQSNPYGASKVSTEAFVATYNQLYAIDAVVLRYFNPYGPNELHDPETHAIPNFIRAVLDRRAIPLYWNGEQVRDFIYVDDLARAHTAVLALKGLDYYNVGSETGSKIIDVLRTIFDIAGYDVPIQDLGERAGDVHATYAWSEKLAAATGWRAQVPLREGLERTVEWFRAGAR